MADDQRYKVSHKGYSMIWEWMRFQAQVHEMDCEPQGISITDDKCPWEHQVSILLTLVLLTVEQMEYHGMFDDDPDYNPQEDPDA